MINIKLTNGITIKSRKNPRVIRYVRFKEKSDPEFFCREQLLLYWPWRNEQSNLLAGGESYKSHYDRVKSFLNSKKKQYDYNSEEIDKAMERAENEERNADPVADVAPINAQQQNDDEQEGITASSQFAFYDPKRTVQQQNYDIAGEMCILPNYQYCNILPQIIIIQRYPPVCVGLNNAGPRQTVSTLHATKS